MTYRDYRLISSPDPAKFGAEVKQAILDGWELFGSPQIVHRQKEDWETQPYSSYYSCLYYQAVVLLKEEPNDPK